jgi:hypothetical protein
MLVKALVPFDLGQGGGLRYPSRVGQTYDLPEQRARKLIAIAAAELAELAEPKKNVAKKKADA